MHGRILHIAGTDTEIGKTTIGSLLIEALVRRGVVPWVMKPVQTDCTPGPGGELFPGDAVSLWEASGKRQSLQEVILYRFRSPVAPLVAARAEGSPIDYENIVNAVRAAQSKAPLVVYEGTGGILVPLSPGKTFADLAADLGAESIVVVGSRLGAMNHASLTFHALRALDLPCIGYVFNDLFADDSILASGEQYPADAIRTNRKLLAEIADGYGLPELAAVPRLRERKDGLPHVAAVADRVIEHFGLSRHDAG